MVVLSLALLLAADAPDAGSTQAVCVTRSDRAGEACAQPLSGRTCVERGSLAQPLYPRGLDGRLYRLSIDGRRMEPAIVDPDGGVRGQEALGRYFFCPTPGASAATAAAGPPIAGSTAATEPFQGDSQDSRVAVLNADVAKRNADAAGRDALAQTEFARRQAEFEARRKADQEAYARALAQYQADKAAAEAEQRKAMQAWRTQVEACRAGDVGQCAPRP